MYRKVLESGPYSACEQSSSILATGRVEKACKVRDLEYDLTGTEGKAIWEEKTLNRLIDLLEKKIKQEMSLVDISSVVVGQL